MKICQVIASKGEGGLEKHVRELSSQLVKQGHQLTVIGDKSFLKTLDSTIQCYPINCQQSRRNPLLLFKLFTLLRAGNYDIIHAQASKATAMVGMIYTFLASPTVATIHNIKRTTGIFQRLDHTIAVSKQLATSFNKAQTSVIYNGIIPPKVKKVDLKSKFELANTNPIIIAVGRLVEAKGFDILLDAITGLPLNLLIAGEGPERRKLTLKINAIKSPTQVKLLGHCSDITDLMASADAVVISSRREGFSYVFNEALLTACKVLATDVPVANEILPDNLIVPTESPEKLRTALQRLLKNDDEWQTLMSEPHQFAKHAMTLQKMTEKTLAVYQELIANSIK